MYVLFVVVEDRWGQYEYENNLISARNDLSVLLIMS